MKKYNASLQKLHESKKTETIHEIQNAMDTIILLEGQNAMITAKKVLQYTTLSRSVLYKEHALKIWNYELWEEKYIQKNQIEMKLERKYKQDFNYFQKILKDLEIELHTIKKQNKKLQITLENEKKRREVRELDMEELKIKHQKVLTECQRLSDLIYAKS
ncbi:hypothetical protein [Bacillus cereus]|uniref:hypothetical protein n=1 Tax=Bacillus cereus TaxID=1396 RepID=UPI000BEDB3EB|nr:hypothetical protein [Bacillus cereus]PEF66697.1 hypothetical protein CON35_11975 [Bacillus cereus]